MKYFIFVLFLGACGDNATGYRDIDASVEIFDAQVVTPDVLVIPDASPPIDAFTADSVPPDAGKLPCCTCHHHKECRACNF